MDIRDPDPVETEDWIEAIRSVVQFEGSERATHLLERIAEEMHRSGVEVSTHLNTPYVNTIPVKQQGRMPGDPELERRIRSYIRWNALAMVMHANCHSSELGGHIAIAALKALADERQLSQETVSEAIRKYGINPETPNPART